MEHSKNMQISKKTEKANLSNKKLSTDIENTAQMH